MLSGTLVNIAAVAGGATIGLLAGKSLSERVRRTLMAGLGLAVLLIGLQLALGSQKILFVIGALVAGGITGEVIGIDRALLRAGDLLQERFGKETPVAEGFVVASLLFCVGAMAITGSLQDGTGDTPTILYAKSALDGIAAIALASTLGVGVLLSAISIGLYQGGLTLMAGSVAPLLSPVVMTEMNAVGGLLIVGIGIDLLGIRQLPVANLLPAIFVVPLLFALFG